MTGSYRGGVFSLPPEGQEYIVPKVHGGPVYPVGVVHQAMAHALSHGDIAQDEPWLIEIEFLDGAKRQYTVGGIATHNVRSMFLIAYPAPLGDVKPVFLNQDQILSAAVVWA